MSIGPAGVDGERPSIKLECLDELVLVFQRMRKIVVSSGHSWLQRNRLLVVTNGLIRPAQRREEHCLDCNAHRRSQAAPRSRAADIPRLPSACPAP